MGSYFHFFDGKAIIELMGKAVYDIIGLGNHEFDRGPGVLGEALEKTDFTTLCSDLSITGTALENSCKPYLIKEYDTIKVGFLQKRRQPYEALSRRVPLRRDERER